MKRELLQRIESLPKSLQQQVLDFIESLLTKKKSSHKSSEKKQKHTIFQWEGALKKQYKNVSSVELQHKIWE
jgi:hypothetical protein